MTQDNERELAAAVILTSKATLRLVDVRSSVRTGRKLTTVHRELLSQASACFEQASKLLATIVDESDREREKEPAT